MNKELIYRNTAMLGALFLLADVIFIGRQDSLLVLSKIIDLIILPITVISASFWYNKNLTLLGVSLYFISYANDLFIEFKIYSENNCLTQYQEVLDTLGIIALVIIIASGFDKLSEYNSWFTRQIKRAEMTITLTAIISIFLTSAIFILNN